MKFAYIAAALLPLAFASPAILDTPQDDALAALDAREDDILAMLEERDEDIDLFSALDEMFTDIEEREAEFDDEFEVEETEIEARSTSSVLGALKKVAKDIGKVNKALNKFGNNEAPSNKQALNVQRAGAQLSHDVKTATSKVKGSKKLSKSGQKKVFKYVKGPLKGATLGSLQKFINHAPGFKKGQFSGAVKKNLKSLKGQTNSLGKALISKATSKKIKKSGKKINKTIQAKFSKAIGAY